MVDFSGLRVVLLNPSAKPPERSSFGAAGYDLTTYYDIVIDPDEQVMVGLGFSTEMPYGVYGKILDRSSMAWKSDIVTSAGVMDNDYRGEWKVLLRNMGTVSRSFQAGNRIAQVVFMHALSLPVNIVDELQDSVRGSGGIGSTGL
jgi:dUTP pyrophosphatase